MSKELTPDKGLIFRITHVRNLPWMLRNGLHCANGQRDPNFVPIGNTEVITKRTGREIPVEPYGALSDYVPFYFTPYSPMLYNIKTGRTGVTPRANEEIAILVSSLRRVGEAGIPFVLSDRNALYATARFSSDIHDLPNWVPWDRIQERNFKRDPEDPDAFERYQAEALIHQHLPAQVLLGIICYTDPVANDVRRFLEDTGLNVEVHVKPGWYFR